MSDHKSQPEPVLLRSSLRLDEKDALLGLIKTELQAELPDPAIHLRLYPTEHKTKKIRLVVCEARGSWHPPTTVVSILRGIARGRFPASANKKLEEKRAKSGSSKISMSMKEMPDAFPRFCNEASGTLNRAIQRFVDVLRWRFGLLEAHPLWAWGSEFSLDGGLAWHGLPHDISLNLRFGAAVPKELRPALVEDAKKLIAEGQEDSTSRQLFREAWALRISNPRGALVVGYVSLEVGCKELIGKLVPDAKWLAMEIPSPPLERLLRDFVPHLPKKLDFTGGPSLPKPLLKHVDDAMKARNTLAHKGKFTWDDDKLDAVLRSFNDLLWIIDVYAGHKWAGEMIRPETLKLLKSG